MTERDFGDEMAEQIEQEHRWLVDDALIDDSETISIFSDEDGGRSLRTVKKIFVGDPPTASYWDPETYEEVFGTEVDKAI